MTAIVSNHVELSRYEVHQGGVLAGFAEYQLRSGEIHFMHTETDAAFAGQGLAKVLIAGALDDVRGQGLSVLPHCEFVAGFIARNAEYLDLVPEDRRAQFGLG